MTVVRRSAVKMWLLAIGGIPLLVIAIDVLTNRRITNWLREIVFAPADTQIYEPRDVIFAWAMLLFSAVIVGWGLKELFWPTKVIEVREAGLLLKLRGPFRQADMVPWGEVVDVVSSTIDDEGDELPVLEVKLLGRGDLPDHPWGARWLDERNLAMLAQDWSKSPEEVVEELIESAVQVARVEAEEHQGRHLRLDDSTEEE